MIETRIKQLIYYGLQTGLIEKSDRIYIKNRLLELFMMDEMKTEELQEKETEFKLEDILNDMSNYAYVNGIITSDSITSHDLFTTKVMGILVARPSEIISRFWSLYKKNPKEATDFFYRLSQDSDYIRRYRVLKDEKWITQTKYGILDITINLSKPEKDPKSIAKAKNEKQVGYPKCLLCLENEGYAGRDNYPARQNHRIIPISIIGKEWGLQYSPYVYYNEHCILFNGKHVPMQINSETFCRLIDFVRQFPHYFVGSNADLPIVGGSILSHDHFQGGNYEFPMAKAKISRNFHISNYDKVEAGIVDWPMSVIRLSSLDAQDLIEACSHVLSTWRNYSDKEAFIFSKTDGELHNTITPIARKRGEKYEMDLVLRNNITTDEHPLGLYHPHARLHHIKKENIGLIEVMGLAVLPARLKEEMNVLADAILEKKDIYSNELIKKHADWTYAWMLKYQNINKDNISEIIHEEIGLVFMEVLEDAGVFKRTIDGQEAFRRFLETL